MHAPRFNERRHDERIPAQCQVQLQPLDASAGSQADLRQCVTRDLSAHGMGVWINDPCPRWSKLLISIEQNDSGHNPVRITSLTGSVVRISPGDNRCLLGIQFGEGETLEFVDRGDSLRFWLMGADE